MKNRAFPALTVLILAVGVLGNHCATSTEKRTQATTRKTSDHPLVLQGEIELQGTKSDLYRLTVQWMDRTLVGAKEGVQFRNENEGKVVGRGLARQRTHGAFDVEYEFPYELTVELRDNSVRVRIEVGLGRGEPQAKMIMIIEPHLLPQGDYEQLKAQLDSVVEDLFSRLAKSGAELRSDLPTVRSNCSHTCSHGASALPFRPPTPPQILAG
jgi:hypothetical protein